MSSKAGQYKNMFIVVDPSQDEPLALQRAIITAGMVRDAESNPPHLHVFMAVDMDNVDTSSDNDSLYRSGGWFFEKVYTPLQESGLSFSLEMCWSSDWYSSIIRSAKRMEADRIMLPLLGRAKARDWLFGESVWHLLRTAPCPVLIVRSGAKPTREKVLAAVNFQSHKPEYKRLNEVIIERGRWYADNYSAQLHLVNAYSDSLHYPDRSQIAQKSGVDNNQIHVRAGDPDDVIAEVAREIQADVVVLGTRARSSRWRGNTSERIINKVDCDILAIN